MSVSSISKQQIDEKFNSWKDREALAEAMIPLIGRLYREKDVITSIFGRPLINRSVIHILKAHRFVRQFDDVELSITDSFPLIQALCEMDLNPVHIDLGKLTLKYKEQSAGQEVDLKSFLESECADALDPASRIEPTEPRDVVLYGFGRIGRLVARILVEKASPIYGLRLRAIVVRPGGADNDLVKRAALLRRDSVHGSFQGTISVDEENQGLLINGNFVQVIYAKDPAGIDYSQYNIKDAIVVDNTGVWRDEKGLGQHLESKGTKNVVLTAPGKGDIKNIVYGVNHDLMGDDAIISAASCTTNAIVPVLKTVNDIYGIECGHVETVHAYTNDQNLIDNYHKGNRRGRSAALNMVITETGAAKAVAKALPELAGKLTGNAIRVPTPNVSMAILNLTLGKATSAEELNENLREAALFSSLQKQIDYVNSPEVVSSDFVGSRYACIVDSESTIVSDNRCVLYIWYDNEFGYSCQVVRMLQKMAGVLYPKIPTT